MKKITLTAVLFFACMAIFAQENEPQELQNQRKNELKINMSNLIGFKWLDFGYEGILNEEATIGVGLLFSLDDEIDGIDEYRTFSITPYYRHFFSNKFAQGFFVEAFTMLHSGTDDYYYEANINGYIDGPDEKKYTDFAVGVSAGVKFVTKRGFVAEVYLGIGRDLLGQNDIEVVGRGGIAIGKRF